MSQDPSATYSSVSHFGPKHIRVHRILDRCYVISVIVAPKLSRAPAVDDPQLRNNSDLLDISRDRRDSTARGSGYGGGPKHGLVVQAT